VAGFALGAFVAFACLVAALVARAGFPDHDATPSTPNLVVLAVWLAASVMLPLILWRVLLPTRFSWPLTLVLVALTTAGCVWILGIAVAG
jgi:hypothetical protein